MSVTRIAIEVLSGTGKGKICIVEESTLIGSGSLCDLRIEDPAISAIHAKIAARSNGTFAITDLTRDPDLRVNNVLVKSRIVRIDDQISIAGIQMRIADPEQLPMEADVEPPPTDAPPLLPGTAAPVTGTTGPQQTASIAPTHLKVPPQNQTTAPVASSKPRQKGTPRWRWIALTFGIVLLPTVIITAAYRSHLRNELHLWSMELHQLRQDAANNPNELLLRRFEAFKACVPAQYETLHSGINTAIAETRQMIAFNQLIDDLDAESKRLSASGDPTAALAVYTSVPEPARRQIAAARAQRIAGLTSRIHAEKQSQAVGLAEARLQAHKAAEVAFNERVRKILEHVTAREQIPAVLMDAVPGHAAEQPLYNHRDGTITGITGGLGAFEHDDF